MEWSDDGHFESASFSLGEDETRAKMIDGILARLRDLGGEGSRVERYLFSKRKALRELSRLLYVDDTTPDTLASSRSVRCDRAQVIEALLEFLEGYDHADLECVTVINNAWRYKTGRLHTVDAGTIKASFKSHLARAGLSRVDGFLVAFLDGEFERESGCYQLHYHLVTTRPKAKALLQGLRGKWGYEKTPTGAVPIRRDPLCDPIKQISYLMKTFWPERPVVNIDGRAKRLRKKGRIIDMQAAEHLLWLHETEFTDTLVLSNVLFRGQKFHAARRKSK